MKFLLDMGVSPLTAKYLISRGHEAIHLADENLQMLQDREILEKAKSEGRVLLTHDLDFADLVAASGAKLPSVVTLRLRDMRPGNVNHCLDQILHRHRRSLEEGAILSVSENQVRVRALPI